MRTRKSAAVRKAEITETALELAFEFGPDRVTTAMIADRLSLTQPAIYKHFPNKEDIWQKATEELCQRIDDNIRGVKGETEPVDRLHALLMGQLQLLHDYPALPEIMVLRDPNAGTTDLRAHVMASMGGLRKAIRQTVSAAQFKNQIRPDLDPEDCTNLLISVVQGLALRLLRYREPENLLSTGKRLLDVQLLLLTETGDTRCDTD